MSPPGRPKGELRSAQHEATPVTPAAFDATTRPRIAPGFRLQWEPAQNCHVLLYPEGMVKLNPSAGEILKRCDGVRDIAAIVTDLETSFAATGLTSDVHGFVALAAQQRWLTWN